MPQMRQNGLDRFRVGDICDHPQRAAAQRADRNIDIKYTLEPLCPTQWRAMRCLIDSGFSGGLCFLENHNEPLLVLPRNPVSTLYVDTDSSYEFLLDQKFWDIPVMTYDEYIDLVSGGIEVYMEDHCIEEDELPDLQSEVDPYLVIELLARTESPNATAYRLLEELRFCSSPTESEQLSGITFYDGPCPGNDYLGAQADDLLAVSLVQHELNNQGWNIAIALI